MTNREIDCVIMGLAAGGTTCLWLGYQLRVRVERWKAGRVARASKRVRRDAKHIPFPSPGADSVPSEQDARAVLGKPRKIPLKSNRTGWPNVETSSEQRATYQWVSPSAEAIPVVRDPSKVDPIPLPRAPTGAGRFLTSIEAIEDARVVAAETARQFREDALAALTGAGYKRAAAEAALDACTMVERAGGLESWVAAALRRAAAKP